MMKKLILAAFLLTALGTATAAEKTNVLFLICDDLNCDIGSYGHPQVRTPNIDRLAKRGVRFERAYCQYPLCGPSRASFMTGLYPDQSLIHRNAILIRKHLPDVVTMSQHFKNHGYDATRIGKIYHYNVPKDIGNDGHDDPASWSHTFNPRGRDKTEEAKVFTLRKGSYGGTLSWLAADGTDEEQTDGIAATEAAKRLEQFAKTKQPFFMAVGLYRPHTPYVAPTHHAKHYPLSKINPVLEKPGDRDDIPLAALHDRPNQRELTVEQKREVIQAYYASTTLMDACLGRVLDALDRLKLTDNTIVVFISDHGYHLGHKGLWQKSDLFEGSDRVPMIISVPGMKNPGQSTASLAELVDLYPTLSDLCGLPKPDHLKGHSLVKVLGNPKATVREAAFTVTRIRKRMPGQKGRERLLGHTIRTKRYRYTEWADRKHGIELYDYDDDPEEITNLAKSASHKDILKRMQTLMQSTRNHTK